MKELSILNYFLWLRDKNNQHGCAAINNCKSLVLFITNGNKKY